jgi:hypothetical protein
MQPDERTAKSHLSNPQPACACPSLCGAHSTVELRLCPVGDLMLKGFLKPVPAFNVRRAIGGSFKGN